MHKRAGRVVRWAAAGALVVAASTLVATSHVSAADWADVEALATCPFDPGADPVVVQLTENVVAPAPVHIACHATIDLNGWTLDAGRAEIASGVTFTISDTSPASDGQFLAEDAQAEQPGIGVPVGARLTITGGTVNATGGWSAAGIGGGAGEAGGTVSIGGGTVTAIGGDLAAGIGGGVNGAGGTTTIEGGTVIAIGGEEEGAGIGGGGLGGGHGGLTTITGGTVTATGGNDGAGIGGGERGNGGTTTITGGTVTATGVGDAAGIGGGEEGHGSTTTISGGSVTANGGRNSAGIGGGEYGDGGTTTIDDGVATITGGLGSPAIGPGCGATNTGSISIGAPAVVFAIAGEATACAGAAPAIVIPAVGGPGLTVDGVLRLSSLVLVDVPDHSPDPAIVVGPLGAVMGPDDTPTAGSGFTGAGTIENNGVIAFDGDLVEVPVSDHNYLVTFNPSTGPALPVRVFAGTFSTGYRTAVSPTVGTAWAVEGADRWWSEGETLTGDLNLVEADATARTVTLLPAGPITAGDSVALQTIVADVFGGPVVPAPPLTFTSTDTSDQISGNTLTATQAGSRTVTATEPVSGADASIVLTVSPGPLAALQLSASATTVNEGDSVTITVTGRDAHGNSVDASAAELTSSVESDIVDGRVVTFPTASPHVITATLGNVSASLTIEVIAAAATSTTSTSTTTTVAPIPGPTTTTIAPPVTTAAPQPPAPTTISPNLPATGGAPSTVALVAAALLAAGTAAIAVARRRA